MLNLSNKLKQMICASRFKKSACVEKDIKLLSGARCINTGKPSNVRIANHCFIGCIIIAKFGGKVSIGENTYIGGSTSIYCKDRVQIGKNVIIANNSMIMDNNNHPVSPEMRLKMSACDNYITDKLWSWEYATSAPVIIEDNVWIGRDVRIMKGVTVGRGSIVALGSIVTKDVPPYSVVAGNPAVVVKTLPEPEADL